MRIKGRNRSFILNNRLITYICIAAVLLMLPTGYAYWTDRLEVVSNIKTGYCDLAFTDAKVVDPEKNDEVKIQKQNEHDDHNHGDKHVTDIGNRLHIHIKDAEPNKITFTVTNYGTAPAAFNTKVKINQPLEIQFTNFLPKSEDDKDGTIIIGPNSSRTGDIILTYTAESEKNYNLLIDLKCTDGNKYEFEVGKE